MKKSLIGCLLPIAAVLGFAGSAYATQLGSVVLTEQSGCDLTNSPPSPIVGAVNLGTATAGNGHLMYYVTEVINYPSGLGTYRAENFIFTFDYTAKTYTVRAPGNYASIGADQETLLSGSFTGSILTTSSGGYAVSVTLGCGTTVVGATENTGT
ncbi:MAG: hypothetical protein ACLQO1_11235 [Steroidobacteraceae bacterium]